MSCAISLNLSDAKALKALKDYCGTDVSTFESYINNVIKGQAADGSLVPSDSFAKWYREKYKKEPDFNSGQGVRMRDSILRYMRNIRPTARAFERTTAEGNLVTTYQYTSPSARSEGKRLVANMVLDFSSQVETTIISNPQAYDKIQKAIAQVGAKTFYFNQVRQTINSMLVDRIAARTGEDKKTIQERINAEKRTYIDKALGGKDMITQDANLVALVYEFQNNPKSFVEEVCLDSRLGDLRFSKDEEFNDEEDRKAVDAQSALDEENSPENTRQDNDDLNSTISMYDHSGTYTSFMMHVNTTIRNYFNSLKKLNSGELKNGEPDYDLANYFGIPDTMNADECCSVMYHYGDFSNIEAMIASVKEIANSLPGFAAFHSFAAELESNLDFAFEVYSTFGKTVIGKITTYTEGTQTGYKLSNQRSNKLDALGYEFMNSIKTTAITVPQSEALDNLESLRGYLKGFKEKILKDDNGKNRKEAVSRIAKLLKLYYPTVNEYAVENYISLNRDETGNVNVEQNIGNLVTIIANTISATEQTVAEYNSRQAEISKAARHNSQVKRDALLNNKPVDESKLEDLNPLYARAYISEKQKGSALELAKALVNYSLVQVETTSPNVLGNQSSDVINNSLITRMLKTLQNDVALGNLGKYKFKSRQYDFSNLLLEHKDANGILNKGLFRYNENGELVPTEYAKDLLKITLFDGASNFDTDDDVLYNQMSQGDYLGTAYILFFDGKEKDMAQYFMRIPSDAPRNFTIGAPKYSAKGLFRIVNQNDVTAATLEMKRAITEKMVDDEGLKSAANNTPIKVNRIDQVVKHLTQTDGNLAVYIPKYILDNLDTTEDKEVTLKFQYSQEEKGSTQDTYLLRGKIENGQLVNAQLVGVYNNDFSENTENALSKYITKQLSKQGKIQYGINKDHVLFRQFKQAFRQELLDAAVALDKFFITDENGLVQRYSADEAKLLGVEQGSIKWKEGISKDGTKVTGAYDNYHHKKGKIVTKKDCRDALVGNVFHSDRFTIFDENEKQVRNYGEEAIEEAFSFLYGGSDNTYLQVTKNADGTIKDVVLTEAQEQKIEEKLEEFITAYVNETVNRMEKFEGSLKGTELNHDNAAEFILNYHLMYVNFNDLFEGDTKFYKDSQTFLKRAKEAQGSGVPYGLVDYLAPLDADKAPVTSRLNGTVFANGYRVTQYNRFNAVTVVNTVQTNTSALNTIHKKLVKDCGLTNAEANKLLYGPNGDKGYQNTTVNDAQSYITFDEWIRRISARGQLMKHKPLIDKILSGEELNAEDLRNFVQVQKNFYFDQHFDEDSNIHAPRQIKNAEFVLIPQLIKGTELEAVAAMMDKYHIDQLNTAETSKAGKTNILEIFDEKTGHVKEDILDELKGKGTSEFGAKASEAIAQYDYNFLYTQQETPQHVNAQNKAGIQLMKKILDNISPTSKLWDTKQRFFNIYAANIKDSFLNLMKELEVPCDENGNLILEEDDRGTKVIKGIKYDLFYQRLKEEAARLGLDSNIMDYVTLDATQPAENGGVTIMPNYMSIISQKLESIAQSIFNNNITRQKLPGFHAAQITNVGFSPLSDTVENVSYSKDLKYHQDEKGNYAPYVEIMLPASAFGFKRTKEDGTLKTKEELLKELQEAGLDEIIGYRIPTEGKQSMCIMKVVGFVDDAYGSTIVVPNDWVTQTGSDFDIDSVYGVQFESVIDPYGHIRKLEYSEVASTSYEKYVKSHMSEDELKEAESNPEFNYSNWALANDLLSREDWSEENKDAVAADNSRAARNNALVQCMLDILSSNEALEENLSRSNSDAIEDALAEIYKHGDTKIVAKRRDGRSAYNFLDQTAYQEDAMSGARLKAFSVTRDTFCSVCNAVRPTITKEQQVKVAYDSSVISYEDAVKRFGKENVEKQGKKVIVTHDKIGWSNDNKNVTGDILTAYSSQTTAYVLDAIKKGAIPNVNDSTFAVFKLFPDLGIDYDTAVAFMMQNGVTRIVEAYNSTNSIYEQDKTDPITAAIKSIANDLGFQNLEYTSVENVLYRIAKKYAKDFADIFGEDAKISLDDKNIGTLVIDGEELHEELYTPRKGKNKALYDLGIVLQYSKLSHLAKGISDLAQVSNPDKFGAKQTIFATNDIFEKIKELISSDTPSVLNVGDETFLNAIYPGIYEGIDSFITSANKKSAYPPLYNFLKYATATSIKINRTLFATQTSDFVAAVKRIQVFLGEDGKLTEKQYKDFEKYIIGYLYNTCASIMHPISFALKDDIGFFAPAVEGETSTEQQEIYAQERRRIFGYGMTPDISFEASSVAEPTQEDVNEFAKLSPAQKVAWVQDHFSDAGVFRYLRTTLFNERETRKNKAGSQTVEFVDTNVNIEDIYGEFARAFSSTNPFIALTAYDIVKYAFAVEGYKMKRNGVSKMIPNSVLYNDFGHYGTGIVSEMQGKMSNISSILSSTGDDNVLDKLCEDYIRSHNMHQIPSMKVRRTAKKGYDLVARDGGIIHINKDEEGFALAEKYNIVYRKSKKFDPTPNSYVRLRFGDKERLYKIKDTQLGYYLYPLNKLEENEHGDFSVNADNNKYNSADFYETVIAEHNARYQEYDIKDLREIVNAFDTDKYKAPKIENYNPKHLAKPLDINNPEPDMVGSVDHLKKAVQTHFGDNNSSEPLIHFNKGLSKKITYPGAVNGIVTKFIINEGTENERVITLDIFKITSNDAKRINKYLASKVDYDNIRPVDEKYRDIITQLRNAGVVSVPEGDLYRVQPHISVVKEDTEDDGGVAIIRRSSITEVLTSGYKGITRASSNAMNHEAAKANQRLRDKGIKAESKSVADHIDETLKTLAEYTVNSTEKILNSLRYFIEDPDGDGYLSVTDPKVIDLIRKNEALRNKYLEALMAADLVINPVKSIMNLDIKSQDPELQRYLNKIKECVNDLQNNLLITKGKELFANEYLAKLSTDPLVQQDILNILDGYNSTNSFTAWVNDLQDTTSPFIQVLSKQVIADISAKEFEALRKVRDWRAFIKGIKAKATAAGKTINWDNIIDEYGRFIQNYVQQLVDDMNELRDAITTAKNKYGEGSFEHLEAQLKYNKWKLEHIEQPLEDDYYRRRIALDEEMLHGKEVVDPFTGKPFTGYKASRTEGYPIVFEAYKKLEARRRELLSHVVNGTLEQDIQDELKKVKDEITNLTSPYYFDQTTGRLRSREEYDPITNPLTGTEEEKREKILYSGASQRALVNYLRKVKELNEEYFEKDVEFGFDEELQRNLHIIDSYENRDASGRPTTPMNILMENEEYVKAKEWVAHNARFVITAKDEDGESLLNRLNQAFKDLSKEVSRHTLRTLARQKEAYDNKGVIDGTKFTEDEIAKIKAEQQADYDYHDDAPLSENVLMCNASPTGEIYTREFYHGMASDGASNPAWYAKVHEINALLAPYYDDAAKKIRFDLIPNTEEGREIYIKLEKLYEELAEIKKTTDASNGKAIREFIEENVDFNIDEEEFNYQKKLAEAKGETYARAWRRANLEIVDGQAVPNHYIYGYTAPKADKRDKYIDKKRTEAIQLINRTYVSTPTEYYYQKAQEMRAKGEEAFNDWYYKNHIYNPYNHNYEPLRCWTTLTFRDDIKTEGEWQPNFNRTYNVPKKDKINPKHKEDLGHALNYKKGTGYDNPRVTEANEFEVEVKQEVQRLLSELATTKEAKRYVDKGYMPSRAKGEEHDAKFWGKEFLKSFGWIEGHSGRDKFFEDIDYSRDRAMPMPMLNLLKQKDLASLKITKPERENFEKEEDFNKAMAKYEEDVKTLKEENAKAHRDAIDKNWESVIQDFIIKAAHYNAVQDNKLMLFYGKSMLENMEVYQRQFGFFGDYKQDYVNSDESSKEYLKRKDTNLIKQYENWVRRIVYDQWKEPNASFTKWASRLQSLTSAQYMMMNIRGGIANITLGETQILAEAFAREYFGTKHWARGKAYWMSGIPSYFANMYSEKSTSVPDAIIKFMNVVDFDELTGKSRIIEDPTTEGFKIFRDAMYSPQTIGENFMQNGAMFSMMMSHRLYEEVDDTTGEKKLVYKNEGEAIRDADITALKSILTEEQLAQFNDFIKNIKEDANQMKEYAWRRRNFVTEFAEQYLNKEQKQKYIAVKKDLTKKAKAEFNNDAEHPTLLSQMALSEDQQLGFKQDGLLAKYDIAKPDGSPSDAYQLLANFKGRVISVNKKIHGVYDRLGQAQLEKTWYGSLVMQYHKHMYPGILKRFRREGYYNEERGTIEKGSYIAIKDFLSIPFRKYKDRIRKAKEVDHLTDAEIEGMQGIQNIIKDITDFLLNIGTHWNLLPEYERANIRRNLGDVVGVLSALFMAVGIRCMMDDDDEDGILFNLALYEADRLASESFQFNPIGMYGEGKKLWSTPIAAQSGIQDLIQSTGLLCKMLMEGDEFDPYYHSGRFAGEHKLSVYIQRRIPIWRGIKTGFIDIADSNSYYKMNQNILGFIDANAIADWIQE